MLQADDREAWTRIRRAPLPLFSVSTPRNAAAGCARARALQLVSLPFVAEVVAKFLHHDWGP